MIRKHVDRVVALTGACLLFLILLVGFLATSYTAAVALSLSTVACLFLLFLSPALLSRWILLTLGVAALLVAGTSLISTHFGISTGVSAIGMVAYDASISPDTASDDPNRFVLRETLQWVDDYKRPIEQRPFAYARTIEAKAAGFAVHEVDFMPLEGHAQVLRHGPYPFLRLRQGKGKYLDMGICTEPCTNARVTLDLPRDSFWQANAPTVVQPAPFAGSETVNWTLLSMDGPVKFNYIDPGWRKFRGVLASYYGASSIGDFVEIALSCFLAAALTGTVPPWLLAVIAVCWKFRARLWARIEPPRGPAARGASAKGSQNRSGGGKAGGRKKKQKAR